MSLVGKSIYLLFFITFVALFLCVCLDSMFFEVFLKYLTLAFFEKLQKMFGWKFLKNSLFLKNTSVWIDQFFKNTTYWITAQ